VRMRKKELGYARCGDIGPKRLENDAKNSDRTAKKKIGTVLKKDKYYYNNTYIIMCTTIDMMRNR